MSEQPAGYVPLPKDFWSTIDRHLTDIVRNVPDVWSQLAEEERARIESQCETFMQVLQDQLVSRLNKLAASYLSEGQPYFIADNPELTIKKGKLGVKMELPQMQAPDCVYTHNGLFIVILAEEQLDWISRLSRAPDDEEPDEEQEAA